MNTFDRAHIPPGKLSFSVKRTCICTSFIKLSYFAACYYIRGHCYACYDISVGFSGCQLFSHTFLRCALFP